ncbi:MAG: DUF899 domain-containing protein [Fimbriimonadaceae bacterium]|nr:MAG: DUF899 domain-containing protein [Fimbriimonadaceae bacterium]
MPSLPHPPIASREEWRAKREELLHREKRHTREADVINAERRRLPMVKLEKDYTFDGPDGKISLRELFEGRRQLIVYHFMFAPDWDKGCSGCTGFINALGRLHALAELDTTFVVVSRAALDKLEKYKGEMGWDVKWFSSGDGDFNYDFHATLDSKRAPVEYNYRNEEELRQHGWDEMEGEMPGASVFFEMDGEVYHTYSVYARGLEGKTDAYALLDLTPYGRQEDFEDSPEGWPQHPTYG